MLERYISPSQVQNAFLLTSEISNLRWEKIEKKVPQFIHLIYLVSFDFWKAFDYVVLNQNNQPVMFMFSIVVSLNPIFIKQKGSS